MARHGDELLPPRRSVSAVTRCKHQKQLSAPLGKAQGGRSDELGRLIYPLQQGVGVGMMCGEFIKLVKASS